MGLEKRIRIYAGQYFDSETGLHYNYHRYYDPSTGRYLTPDPIGLAGGINLFAYVQNNPVNAVDPLGLFRSYSWQRTLIPGQVLFDYGMTSFEKGYYGQAGLYFAGMVGEQALFALSFGQYGAAEIGGQCAASEGIVQGQFGNVSRSILEAAAKDTGDTIKIVTKLTQAPQAGRALSAAVGEEATSLANAAREGGQIYSANIPKALIAQLERAGLVSRTTTQMGEITATELRFLPQATEFIVNFFK